MLLAIPTTDASAAATGATIDRVRRELPSGSLVGGAAAENHDLEKVLSARTPLVFGLLIGLGFLLLLVALGSPLVAFVGTVTNLASIAAAFGVAKLIFQDGHLSGLLNFEPQGFVDAWGPLFFGAMLTGVAMDYTLFLLSAAREHYDATGRPAARDARSAAHLRAGRRRRRRRHGRGVPHLRPVRAARAEGDGHHPRRRGVPRRPVHPPGRPASRAPPHRPRRLARTPLARTASCPTSRSPTESPQQRSDSMPDYGITTVLDTDFADAVDRTRTALAEQGFGVLTEIDVAATMKTKLDIDMAPYLILGACNPPLAHRAITAEAAIGLLLPCNVVVRDLGNGSMSVEAMDPDVMVTATGNSELAPVAAEARAKLVAALAALEPTGS